MLVSGPEADLKEILNSGMLPNGNFLGSEMGEVVNRSTSKLTGADLAAVIVCLRSLPPISHRVQRKKREIPRAIPFTWNSP